MNNIKTNTLFFVLMAFIFVAYGAISFVYPQDLIQWLSQHYNLNAEKTASLGLYVNESAWFKMKVVLVVSFLFVGYLFFYDKNVIKEIVSSMIALFYRVKGDILTLSIKQQTIVFTLLASFGLALMGYSYLTPIQLDELHTWLYFIDRGALVTASYYPASNNHIAYNLLSILGNQFLPPLWAVRIISLFSAIAAAFLFFLVLRQRYTLVLSIAGMLLLMSAAPFVWYGVQGRGYVLELFGLLVILYALVQPYYDVNTDRLLVLWNAFTLYVIPIAAIPIALLNLFYAYKLLREDRRNIRRILRTAVYSIVLVFLCYAPVIIFSGFESLINNPFVQRVNYNETWTVGLTDYMPGIWNFVSGCNGIFSFIVLSVLGLGGIVCCLKKNKMVLWFIIVLMIPFILLQFYPVLLFERTWLWLIVPFIGLIIEVVNLISGLKKGWSSFLAGCFILLIIFSNLFRLYTTNALLIQHSERFMDLKQAIEVHAKGKILLVYDDAIYEYLLYYQRESKNYTLLYSHKQSKIKADVLLKSKQDFKPSDGQVLWMDDNEVLYARSSNI